LDATAVRVDGAPVEFPKGLLVMLNKPAGVVCSRDAREGRTVFDLLPPQWSRRQPPVTTVGRLDRETTGLILITDVGELVHRWTSPRRHVEKVYEVVVDQPLRSELVERFASGRLWLEGESRPCLPARLELTGEREARVVLTEGKYHQVRRMFAAEGFCVVRLHRSRFGEFELGDLAEGSWREAPLPGA
jgi:16S rRNA pseudouridine516 synthase